MIDVRRHQAPVIGTTAMIDHNHLLQNARAAAAVVPTIDHATRAAVLRGLSDCFEGAGPVVQMMNARDVQAARAAGIDEPGLERLLVTGEAIASTVNLLRDLASQPDPVGVGTSATPRGVIGVVHHAPPMFTIEAFARCFLAGNACIIKGSDDSKESSITLMKFIQAVLEGHGLPAAACQVPAKATPAEVDALRHAAGVDLWLDERSDLGFSALTLPRPT